ncbi:MAG: hypothetical protein LBQ61_06190 [Spirochaetales bacterium]|jgi:hexokinase|nr:hypothetical protein [Spirochaetales bacterium]
MTAGNKKSNKKLIEFLIGAGFPRPEDLDPGLFVFNFHKAMDEGLAGRPSDLGAYPSYLCAAPGLPGASSPLTAAVIDAGGTRLRTALAKAGAGGRVSFSGLSRELMPGVEGELSRRAFFEALAEKARPAVSRASRIGFCFSYPMEQQSAHEGRLKTWSKGIKAAEVVGQEVGAGLLEALGYPKNEKKIVLLNDTIAAYLAAPESRQGQPYASRIGLVLGTGLNAAWGAVSIPKIGYRGPPQAVNLEAGNFSAFPLGALDNDFLLTISAREGSLEASGPKVRVLNPLEKVTSGAYLGPLLAHYLKAAAGEGYLSPGAAGRLASYQNPASRDWDDFIRDPYKDHPLGRVAGGGEADTAFILGLADRLLERAAGLAACLIAALLCRCELSGPVCLCVEGSTFWNMADYRRRIRRRLKGCLRDLGITATYDFVRVKDACLTGAAKAAFGL